jgi:hypothetical protein
VAFWREYLRFPPFKNRRSNPNHQHHLYVDVEDDRFNRYLFLLITFFLIRDWRISVRHRFQYLCSGDRYSVQWCKSGKVRVAFREPLDVSLRLETPTLGEAEEKLGLLSADYFGTSDTSKCWNVPMAMHPMQYDLEWRNQHEVYDGRRIGVIFSGNTDAHLYGNVSLTENFGIPTRNASLAWLKQTLRPSIRDDFELPELLEDGCLQPQLYVGDRIHSEIPGARFRETLARFAFALALPGWAVPLCHNAVEALSVGCVPIIHRTYAKYLHPKLQDGVNCLIYSDLEDLRQIVFRALSMKTTEINQLSCNARKLYQEFFTPTAVVDGVVKAVEEGKTIRLFAELESLRLFNEGH